MFLGRRDANHPSTAAPELSHISCQQEQNYKAANHLFHMPAQMPCKISVHHWIKTISKAQQNRSLSETKPELDSFLVQYSLSRMTVTYARASLMQIFSFYVLKYVKLLLHSMKKTSRSYTVVELAQVWATTDGAKCVPKLLSCANSVVPLPQVRECNSSPLHT